MKKPVKEAEDCSDIEGEKQEAKDERNCFVVGLGNRHVAQQLSCC